MQESDQAVNVMCLLYFVPGILGFFSNVSRCIEPNQRPCSEEAEVGSGWYCKRKR